jgi:hypothetical protein
MNGGCGYFHLYHDMNFSHEAPQPPIFVGGTFGIRQDLRVVAKKIPVARPFGDDGNEGRVDQSHAGVDRRNDRGRLGRLM